MEEKDKFFSEEKTETESSLPENEIQEGKFFALIGYLSFLCFVPLLLKKDNRFAMFHGKQALILFILELAVGVIKVIPFVGEFIGWIGFVALSLISLFCIYKVLTDEMWQIPYVYEISKQVKL